MPAPRKTQNAKRKTHGFSRGFTIGELVVVTAIIGLLVAIVSVNLMDSRVKARDTKRMADLDQVHLALKSFHSLYRRYPSSADGNCNSEESFGVGGCLEVLITLGAFNELPVDPDSSRQYYYDNWCQSPGPGSDDQQFRMWANGERNHNGTTYGWEEDTDIGVTICEDPT